MTKKVKKISLRPWVVVLSIIVAIGLIVGSFFLGKSVSDKHNSNTGDTFKKWGITFSYADEPYYENYQVGHTETSNSLKINSSGTYICPKPGEKRYIEYCEAQGFNDTSINLDTTSKITFTIGSFMKDNTFYCPLIFHVGLDDNGKSIIIDGNDYIGKKYEFEKAIDEAISANDIRYLPKGTNVSDTINKFSHDYYVEFPSNKSDLYNSLSNAKYDFELEYALNEVK